MSPSSTSVNVPAGSSKLKLVFSKIETAFEIGLATGVRLPNVNESLRKALLTALITLSFVP